MRHPTIAWERVQTTILQSTILSHPKHHGSIQNSESGPNISHFPTSQQPQSVQATVCHNLSQTCHKATHYTFATYFAQEITQSILRTLTVLHILSARSKQKHGTAAAFFDLDFPSTALLAKMAKRSECSNDAWTQHIYPIYTRHNILPVCMGRVYLSHLYRSKIPESFNRNVKWQQQEE